MVLSSCTVNLGHFTVASSNNVKDLQYKNDKTFVEGSSCLYFGFGKYNGRIESAMGKAIRSGQRSQPTGDMLIDVVIDVNMYPFVNCVSVTGDLVSSQNSSK